MTMGFTTVVYGAVSIFRCTTKGIAQEPMWDESRTNLLYMKTTINVTGYLNGRKFNLAPSMDPTVLIQNYNLTDPGAGPPSTSNAPQIPDPMGSAASREQQIRRQLGPRQRFTMLMGDSNGDGTSGTAIIDAWPAPSDWVPGSMFVTAPSNRDQPPAIPGYGLSNIDLASIDLNNGPRCTGFSITAVTGDELYSIEATFEVALVECDANLDVDFNNYGVLSNRWSCHDTLDGNLRTIRTYRGHLKVASANINVQSLRKLVLPPIVQMFRRDAIEIDVSEDGLTMNWSVVDIEASMSPPWPARKWEVIHTQGGAANTQVTYMGLNTVEVNLTGDVNCNKANLIELAMYIITAKLFGVTPPNVNNNAAVAGLGAIDAANFWEAVIVRQLEFVDYIGDEVRITARAVAQLMTAHTVDQKATPNNFTIDTIGASFGTPLNSDDVNTTGAQNAAQPPDNANPARITPPYDRSFSWGGYVGDNIEYASPAASIANIFLNYMQTPCNDQHLTAQLNLSGGIRSYRNLADLDRNPQGTNLGVTPPMQSPTTYNVAVYPSINPLVIPNDTLSVSQNTAAYTRWQLENIYKTKTMRVQLPIARVPIQYSQGVNGGSAQYLGASFYPTSSFGAISGPQTIRILRVSAERIGQEPQFPDPDALPMFTVPTSQSNALPIIPGFPYPAGGGIQIWQTCLKKVVRPCTPVLTVMGQYLYRADAEYTIALSRSPNPGEQLDLGNDMWAIGKVDLTGQVVSGNSPWYQTTSPGGQLTSADWSKQPNDVNVTSGLAVGP